MLSTEKAEMQGVVYSVEKLNVPIFPYCMIQEELGGKLVFLNAHIGP